MENRHEKDEVGELLHSVGGTDTRNAHRVEQVADIALPWPVPWQACDRLPWKGYVRFVR